MASTAFDNIKEVKALMQEFQEKRVQAFLNHHAPQGLLASLEKIKKQLIDKLEDQKNQSKAEIKKAEVKKTNLIKRLVFFDKVNDVKAQDEVIKELEEYSRIRRYREAQLARINKEIIDLNLTQAQFQEKMKKDVGKQNLDRMFENI